jgi:DNA-binding LacI/PurR family transcriptional regulator
MPQRAKYTMRDVARLAGVSTATVSGVINCAATVSPERRSRVEMAMLALDYQPDAIARSLKTGKSNTIGIIVPDITNAFYPEVIRGAEEAALESGYSVLLCDSSENSQIEERHLSVLVSRRVDGILLVTSINSRAHEKIARQSVPIVFVDHLPPVTTAHTVCTDNVQAGQLAAEHLIHLGHRRIGMIAGSLTLSSHRDRLEGFRKAMQENHLPIFDEHLICGDAHVEDGLAAGHRLLDLSSPPTAIMATTYKLLLGLLQAADERGVVIPNELSVLGFDDYLWNRHFNPTLTAVAQTTHEMGKRSFELLRQLIQNPTEETTKPMHVLLPAELRVRKSTAAPSTSPDAETPEPANARENSHGRRGGGSR